MTEPAREQRRILFCTLGYEPGQVGGAERQARLQAEELTRRGWRVEVVTARDPDTRSGHVGAVYIQRLPSLSGRTLRTLTYPIALLAWLLLNARRYDLVHVHLANLQADVVAFACRLLKIPFYVKLAAGGPRGEVARMRSVAWLTRRIGVRWAARAQATSNEIAEDLRAIGFPESRVVRIPNGLPPGTSTALSEDERLRLRGELGLPIDRLLVLYAGRFARYKGVLDLVRAWADSAPVRPSTLVLVGEPAIDDPVEVPATGDTVVIPWTDRVGAYFQACDIYAHPSHADGMPNAVLEAMSAGLAVVATRVAAVPEMISDRETGLLVPIGDVEALRAGITELISNDELRGRLGAAAAAQARRTYPIAAVVDRIEATYQEILEEAGR